MDFFEGKQDYQQQVDETAGIWLASKIEEEFVEQAKKQLCKRIREANRKLQDHITINGLLPRSIRQELKSLGYVVETKATPNKYGFNVTCTMIGW